MDISGCRYDEVACPGSHPRAEVLSENRSGAAISRRGIRKTYVRTYVGALETRCCLRKQSPAAELTCALFGGGVVVGGNPGNECSGVMFQR